MADKNTTDRNTETNQNDILVQEINIPDRGNFNLLRRIPIIHRAISNNSYPNTQTLKKLIAQELREKELSTSTLNNYIAFLKNECNAPIEFDFHLNGYYYTDPDFKLELYRIPSQIDTDTFEKKAFAKLIGVDVSLINNLEKYTRLGIKDETALELNLEQKWCGRFYFDRNLWIGIKVFGDNPEYKLCFSIYEGYDDKDCSITKALRYRHLNYIAEDCPLDQGYYHYVMFNNELLLQADEALAKYEFRRLTKFLWREDL